MNEERLEAPSGQLCFEAPPQEFPSTVSTDAPLLGNGSLLATIGGPPEDLQLILGRNDFWRLEQRHERCIPVPVGCFRIQSEALKGASYRVRQDLRTATTRGAYKLPGGAGLALEAFVAATEDVLVLRLTPAQDALAVSLSLTIESNLYTRTNPGSDGWELREEYKSHPPVPYQSDNSMEWADPVFLGTRAFNEHVGQPTAASLAWRIFGGRDHAPLHVRKDEKRHVRMGQRLSVPAGETVTVVLASSSLFKSPDYRQHAKSLVQDMASADDLQELERAHREWWEAFWERGSTIAVDDPALEKSYYRAQYTMASASRDPSFPPGLFGWTTHDSPKWMGDYHMNYNHMAPFYGLYTTNCLDQARTHYAPILDFVERGREYARSILDTGGVFYPVGIGPLGYTTGYKPFLQWYVEHGLEGEDIFLMQRSNAAYGLVNMATDWHYTRDLAQAERIYPYAREVVRFWEDYLAWEDNAQGGRYVVRNDAVHEGSGTDTNSILSLGLVRNSLELLLDMSEALGKDEGQRARWQEILETLSPFPTQEREGKQVFRYTEDGMAWADSNTLGIQHIFPGGQVHLDSPAGLLQVARNTIEAMGRWVDFNGSNSFFMAAIRSGYDPEIIWKQLHVFHDACRENGFLKDNPHGIEACSVVPNAVNEMLCMSHRGVIRPFAMWPRSCANARFTNIRAWGAFLVSSALRDGEAQYVKIHSERGSDCTVVNPWPGKRVLLTSEERSEILSGARFTFKTKSGETLELRKT